MPHLLLQLVMLLGGGLLERGASAGLRKLLGTAGASATAHLAGKAGQAAAGSAAGRVLDAGLGRVGSHLPAAIGSRLNTSGLASNAVQLGGMAAKMGMYSAPFMLMDGMGHGDSDKSIDGWEMFQGQPAPDAPEQQAALASVEQQAAQHHLERALKEYLAYSREQGGLY